MQSKDRFFRLILLSGPGADPPARDFGQAVSELVAGLRQKLSPLSTDCEVVTENANGCCFAIQQAAFADG